MIGHTRFARRCVWVAAVATAVLSGACKQKREAKFESTAAKSGKASAKKELGLDIQIDPDHSLYQPWSRAKVTLRIKNRSRVPVLLLDVKLKTSGGTPVLSESGVQKHPMVREDSKLRIEGAYFVDDVGARQRAARPAYWRWRGKHELAVFRLLMPLQERTWSGRFRARYEVGDSFEAVVRYAPVPKSFRYYKKVESKRVRLAKPQRKGSMVARSKVVVSFRKHEGIPAQPGAKLGSLADIGKRRRKVDGDKRDVYAVPVSYLQGLDVQTETASHPLGLRRFAFDIGRARTKAGIDRGPYTRAVDAGVWVLFGKGKSWVVSREEVLPVEGNALPFANRLNAARRQPVYLFHNAETRDPDGLLAYFEKQGFRVKSRREKGGAYTGVLELESARFVAFLKALAKRKLRVDGVDTVAPIQ